MVPNSVRDYLEAQGHEVFRVQEHVLRGATDRAVVAAASELQAIVITWNRRHYRTLITRSDSRSLREFPHAGLVSLEGEYTKGVDTLSRWIRRIEAEFSFRQIEDDKRVIVEVKTNGFVIR